MSEITKPSDLSLIWASGGDKLDPGSTKYQTGWGVELPPRQWENFIQNKQDQAIAHINQHGVAVWDNVTEYEAGKSYVQGATSGLIYKCKVTNTNQIPETDVSQTYWAQAFISPSDLQQGSSIYALDTGTANTYTVAYTPAITSFVDGTVLRFKAKTANTGASTFNPNGLGAKPIVGLAYSALQGGEIVASGDVWVQYNSSIGAGSWVLIDSAGGAVQVTSATQTGQAVNLGQFGSSMAPAGWQKLASGLIIQWSYWSVPVVGSSVVTQTVTLPISFPTAHYVTVGGMRDSTGNTSSIFTYVGQSATLSSYEVSIVPNTTVNTSVGGYSISIGR